MDCNNYSNAPGMLGNGRIEAEYKDPYNYICVRLEQWGSNPKKKVYTVSGLFIDPELTEICEAFTADFSQGWETARHAYKKAIQLYNKYVPDIAKLPTF